jgi:hypothetical protein
MAIESADIPSIPDDDVLFLQHPEAHLLPDQSIKSSTCLESTNPQMSCVGGTDALTKALYCPESVCRKLQLPAMEDRTEKADAERISTIGSWVGSLSCWIDAVSEGRGLNAEEAAAVERLQRCLEDGSLVAAVVSLLRHSQVGVEEYSAEVLGRLYIAPLMEAQSAPATRAARLQGLMTLLHRHGALQACVHVLSAVGRPEDPAGTGEAVLPCTVLSVLNCLQSVVTFHPEALADACVCASLVDALARTALRATPATYRAALSTRRAAAAVPLLCGGRRAAEAAGADDEANVWSWEVRESAGMTLAQVRPDPPDPPGPPGPPGPGACCSNSAMAPRRRRG